MYYKSKGMWQNTCKRCLKPFFTTKKTGKICDECNLNYKKSTHIFRREKIQQRPCYYWARQIEEVFGDEKVQG